VARILLYREGDPSEEAHLIAEGTITVSHESLTLPPHSVENLVLGTLEFLVAESMNDLPPRALTVEVETSKSPYPVPYAKLENMLLEYEAGHRANEYLAYLIDETNNAIETLSTGPLWRKYKTLARHIHQAMQRLRNLTQESGFSGLEEFFQHSSDLHLVRYGELHFDLAPTSKFPIEVDDESVVEMAAGTTICRENDPADTMYVLLRGSLSIRKGERVVGEIHEAGEAFGELSFFLNERRTADVVAREKCALLLISKDKLKHFHYEHPLLFFHLGRTLAHRVQNNLQELKETEWIGSDRSGKAVHAERDQFLELLRKAKRLGPPNTIIRAIQEIDKALSSVRFSAMEE
jgi:CRP-like cAMP-binding protein